jgi:hypothetical protein
MPPLTRQIPPHPIIRLRILQNLHINIHNSHALRTPTQLTQRANKRDGNLRQPAVPFPRRSARIRKDDRFPQLALLHKA